MAKKSKFTDLTIERLESEDLCDDPTHYMVQIGDFKIEAMGTEKESEVAAWIRSSLHETRRINARRSGPVVVSLCAFKGGPQGVDTWNLKKSRMNPNHWESPYRAISICIAGCRVLIYRLDPYSYNFPGCLKPLRDLLDREKVVVLGIGIKEIAQKLDSHWGLTISHPVDIRKIAAEAYGKDSICIPKHKKGTIVIKNLGLEEMAELVLDGLLLKKKPARFLEANWGYEDEDEREDELMMYATRDAFLCYEIGVKCVEKSGLPIEKFV